jgi:hypothetical protein
MKKILPLLLIWLIPVICLGQPCSFDWALDCGNPPNSTDGKTTVASDQEGNLFMAGESLNIRTKDGMEVSDLVVTDLSGRVLLLIPSRHDGPVDVSMLSPGAYVISANEVRTGQLTRKIFIRR